METILSYIRKSRKKFESVYKVIDKPYIVFWGEYRVWDHVTDKLFFTFTLFMDSE